MPKASLYLDAIVVLSAYLPDNYTSKVFRFLAKQKDIRAHFIKVDRVSL